MDWHRCHGKFNGRHLINKGYQVSVYNRTKSKTDNLVEKGAQFKTPNG